jgi:hypothetical protein
MKIKISFFSLFKKFFLHPRQTTRKILDKNPNLYLGHLVAINLIAGSLGYIYTQHTLKDFSWPSALLTGFVYLGIFFVSIFVGPFFIYWIGKKIGGQSTFQKVRAVYLWSHTTLVLVLAPVMFYLNNRVSAARIFLQIGKPIHPILLLVYLLVGIFLSISMLVFLLRPFVLYCISFSETQRISVLKSGIVLASWWVINWLFWSRIVHFLNFNPNYL